MRFWGVELASIPQLMNGQKTVESTNTGSPILIMGIIITRLNLSTGLSKLQPFWDGRGFHGFHLCLFSIIDVIK
jgi:hypothetical protein